MNILQKIFIDHFEEIKYTLHPRDCEMENIEKMINCGDLPMAVQCMAVRTVATSNLSLSAAKAASAPHVATSIPWNAPPACILKWSESGTATLSLP